MASFFSNNANIKSIEKSMIFLDFNMQARKARWALLQVDYEAFMAKQISYKYPIDISQLFSKFSSTPVSCEPLAPDFVLAVSHLFESKK